MRNVNKLWIPVAVLLLLFSFMRKERHAAPVPQQRCDSTYVPYPILPGPMPADTLQHCSLSPCGDGTYRLSLPPGSAIRTSVL